MNKISRVLALAMIAFLLISTSVTASKYEGKSLSNKEYKGIKNEEYNNLKNKEYKKLKNKEYRNLKSLGFTDEEIKFMPQSYIDEYKDIKGKSVSKDYKYIKMTKKYNKKKKKYEVTSQQFTEQQALEGIDEEKANTQVLGISTEDEPNDFDKDTWIKLETTITQLSNSDEYLYKTSFKWLSKPLVDIDEYISTSWSPNVSAVVGSELFQMMYEVRDRVVDSPFTWHWAPEYTDSTVILSANMKGPTGYGFNFRLGGGSNRKKYNHRGYMAYKVTPIVEGVSKIDAYGDYAHKTIELGQSVSISFEGLSLGFKVGISSVESIHADYKLNK